MDDYEKAKHQGELLRWQKLFESALHSDKVAADIGVFVLKVVLAINGAALAALLAALAQLKGQTNAVQSVQGPAKLFFAGLMAAVLAAGLAYFYQSFITAKDWNELHKAFPAPGVNPPFAWAEPAAKYTIMVVVALAIAAYALFGIAAWDLIGVIPGLFKAAA